MDKKIISIDMGTTRIKVVKHKHGDYYFEEYSRWDIDDIVERAVEKEYDVILLTGSGASSVTSSEIDIFEVPIPIIRLNELECVGNIVSFEGEREGLVVNVGTGTSFLHFEEGMVEHVTGTGVGGGTFDGLAERLLGTRDYERVEQLATRGDIGKVNLVIDDIYPKGLGWLQGDITVSNFAKLGLVDEDVALAIHSMVVEPIISLVKGLCHFKRFDNIYFSGGVLNNKVVGEIIEKYAKFFDFEYKIIDNPSFGTALGAIDIYKRL